MSEGIKLAIAFICGVIVFVYCIIKYFINKNTRGNRLKEKAERDGTIVVAKAIKHLYRRETEETGQDQSMTVVYEYSVNNKKYRKKLRYYNSGRIMYNDEVRIYYDKNNPRKAVASAELGTEQQTGCLITIFVPIIIIIVIFNLLRIL